MLMSSVFAFQCSRSEGTAGSGRLGHSHRHVWQHVHHPGDDSREGGRHAEREEHRETHPGLLQTHDRRQTQENDGGRGRERAQCRRLEEENRRQREKINVIDLFCQISIY